MTHRMEQSPPPPIRDRPAPPSPPWPQRPPPPPRHPPQKGGGGGANDPLVGTKVHVPYPRGVEVGTVTHVRRRKAVVVWVEYPGNPTLYEVARGRLFPSPEAGRPRTPRVCSQGQGESHPPPPPPSGQPDLKTNPLTDPKTNPPTNPKTNPPSNPKAQNNPTPNPTRDPTQQSWDPKTGSQEV